MNLTIRDVTSDDDLERVVAVRNRVEVDERTLASIQAERKTAVARLDLLAEADGRDVGAGSIAWGPISVEGKNVFLFAWVAPEDRRQGIGGAIIDRLIAFARAGGMERATTLVYEHDPDGIGVLERRGFSRAGGGSLGRLDLTAAATDRGIDRVPGITIVSHAERRDLDRALYDLEALVQPEIPFIAEEPTPTYEAWQGTVIGDPGYLTELSLIALDGERVVGEIELFDDGEGTMFIGMTAVHPDVRRRGVARLLKVELERRARAAGWRRIETFNDLTNPRIRGLNESLGYVYLPPYVKMQGPIA